MRKKNCLFFDMHRFTRLGSRYFNAHGVGMQRPIFKQKGDGSRFCNMYVGKQYFCDEKKNIIDEKFMDLLMDVGLDADDLVEDTTKEQYVTNQHENFQAFEQSIEKDEELEQITDEPINYRQEIFQRLLKSQAVQEKIEGKQQEERDLHSLRNKRIKRLQTLIRMKYTPDASAEVLQTLKDKKQWPSIAEQLRDQLGGKIVPHDQHLTLPAMNTLLSTVYSAFDTISYSPKHQITDHDEKTAIDTEEADFISESEAETKENINLDKIQVSKADRIPFEYREDTKVEDGDTDIDKIEQFINAMDQSLDIGDNMRQYGSDDDVQKARKAIAKRPAFDQEQLLDELYKSDPEDDGKEKAKTFFTKFAEKLEREGDNYVRPEEVSNTLRRFCSPVLRKWTDDAVGALVGKGRYNRAGDWVPLSRIDKEFDPETYTLATQDLTVPAYTFRVVGLPKDKSRTVKRAYIPPPLRTKIPDYLVGRYRFGITPEMVERLELSDKLKKVLSYAYASHTEIRRARLDDAVKKFGKRPNDCGNTAVQLCMLNQRVRQLEDHCKFHRKDQNAKRQLRIVVSKRRRLYKYLKRRDLTTYYNVLKDQVIEDKFFMYENEGPNPIPK